MNTSMTELTPLSYLNRARQVFADKIAVIDGECVWTFKEFADRVESRARTLLNMGVESGDRVAVLLPNTAEMLVEHFAIPLAGGVIVAINTRLASEEVRYILDHSQSKVLIVDAEFSVTIASISRSLETVETIAIDTDPNGPAATVEVPGARSLSDFHDEAAKSTQHMWQTEDEHKPIAINYTSGTTGRPKGVVYTHRGTHLNAVNQIVHSGFDVGSVYLWTLPMFHCNGWCTPWALVAVGGTQICLRAVRGDEIWDQIEQQGVTHLNGAPTVVRTIGNAERAHSLEKSIIITTGGAPLSPTTFFEMEELGFHILHIYGLTETYGPYSVCQWQDSWAELEPLQQARLRARQGVPMIQADGLRVVERGLNTDGQLKDVPADGRTMGEIVMRGNTVMAGYFRDPESTDVAFAGGWFHSGDLGVMHPDGYVELRDRAKDVIISGGENITTIEVEHAIASHPHVSEVAVVGVPDEQWGERPRAFVVARDGQALTEETVIAYVRTQIAGYKVPREVVIVAALPKTSTGKIQKFSLRDEAWAETGLRING